MSILTKLQDLRTEEENTLRMEFDLGSYAEMWERLRNITAAHPIAWLTTGATAPQSQPLAQILHTSNIGRGQVIIYDHI